MQKVVYLDKVPRYKSAQLGEKLSYQLKKFCLEKKILGRTKAIVDRNYPLDFITSFSTSFFLKGTKFTLLNRSKEFRDDINWNFKGFGLLWNKTLNSFEYLNSESISAEDGVEVIYSFIRNAKSNKTFCDSHCVTQRIINAIKFLSRYKIDDPVINEFLYYHCLCLKKNPEFHLRNHHLLDNGFALLLGSLFFRKYALFDFSERLLLSNISKQILADGAHIELSPSYHLLVLHRMLTSLHLLKESHFPADRLSEELISHIPKMLGWIQQLQLTNGCLPSFNDCNEVYGISFCAVMRKATEINMPTLLLPLKESGFRKLKNRNFEMVVDVNGFSPAEFSGSGTSDAFHFMLNVFGEQFIVDTGVSTHVRNRQKIYKRSTLDFKTLVSQNSSNSLQTNKKSRFTYLAEMSNELEATHDGYSQKDILHTRKITFKNDFIEIVDKVRSKNSDKPVNCKVYLHVDKKSGLVRTDDKFVSRFTTIEFSNTSSISLKEGWHTPGFGVKSPCYVISTNFQNEFITRIKVNKK